MKNRLEETVTIRPSTEGQNAIPGAFNGSVSGAVNFTSYGDPLDLSNQTSVAVNYAMERSYAN